MGSRIIMPGHSFSPWQLFARGRQGVWIEPGMNGTLFTSNTGETAASAGSTVGLALDKSKGLALGPELLTNGDFSQGSTGWSNPIAGAAITGGALAFDGITSIFNGATITTGTATIEANRVYRVVYKIVDGLTAAVSINFGGVLAQARAVANDYIANIATLSTATLSLQARLSTGIRTGSIDNISVRQILCNHASQATATARPIFQIAPNRLVFQADDSLVFTFPSELGTNCTVARGVAGGEPVILTGQNIGTTYTLGLDVMSVTGFCIYNGPLVPPETTQLTRYLRSLG